MKLNPLLTGLHLRQRTSWRYTNTRLSQYPSGTGPSRILTAAPNLIWDMFWDLCWNKSDDSDVILSSQVLYWIKMPKKIGKIIKQKKAHSFRFVSFPRITDAQRREEMWRRFAYLSPVISGKQLQSSVSVGVSLSFFYSFVFSSQDTCLFWTKYPQFEHWLIYMFWIFWSLQSESFVKKEKNVNSTNLLNFRIFNLFDINFLSRTPQFSS